MAVTTSQTVDVAEAIVALLGNVEGLRTYAYAADTTRLPSGGGVAVVGLPSIDWRDPESSFCEATWDVPVLLATGRNDSKAAQAELSRLVRDVANALRNPAVDGIFDITPADARPVTATIAGQELPGYQLRVLVRA